VSNQVESILDPTAAQAASSVAEPAVDPAAQSDDYPQYTREEVMQLDRFARQAAAELERLKPYRDEIEEIASDEEMRNFYKTSRDYYKKGKQELQPATQTMPADDDMREVVSYVKSQRQREIEQNNATIQRFNEEQHVVAQRLKRDHGLDHEKLVFLAETADTMAKRSGRFVGLEEAYNTVKGFSSPAAGNKPPTVALRGDASTPGVPSASTNKDRWKSDFHGALTDQLRAGKS